MPEVEIIEMRTKDVETGTVFNAYPEGEIGWVTYNERYDYYHNIDLWFKLRNNTDASIMATFRLYNPWHEIVTLYSIPIDAHGEFSYTIGRILDGRFPETFTAEAWIEGGEKHTVNFTIDEGNFLWIDSELPCKVEVSGELRFQRPEEGLYIFPHNAPVSLYAIPPFCHVFKKWRIDLTDHYENPVSFSMEANHTAIAYFEPAR